MASHSGVVILQRAQDEHAMLLSKARYIHDASLPSALRPPALQHRAATALPTVTTTKKRPSEDRQEAAVAAFVVQVHSRYRLLIGKYAHADSVHACLLLWCRT